MHDLAVELRDQGHEVIVAAPDDSLTERRSIGEEDGLTVVRVRAASCI